MRWWFWALCCWAATAHTQPLPPTQRFEFSHPQMGTIFRVVFYAEVDTAEAAAVATTLFQFIDSLNGIFSDWLPESELTRLCATAGNGQRVQVSPPLFDILTRSEYFARQSGGAFDVTIGPLTRLWRRAKNLKEMPDSTRVQAAHARVGWRKLRRFKRNRQVELTLTGMQLDLGGIAQGWTADACLALLEQKGIRSAMVDAGGDIALGAPPPEQKGWKIEAPNPGKAHTTQLLWLSRCGITTSGAQYRYVEFNGKRYSHIIDPRTGMPLTHRTQVTVLAPNATTADAWATAISVLGENGWRALKKKPSIQVWLSDLPD